MSESNPAEQAEDELREHAENDADEARADSAAGEDADVLREHAEDPAEG